MNLTFGDIVVVEGNLIGVVCKLWQGSLNGIIPPMAEVYVRNYNKIKEYPIEEVQRYMVRHKELDEEELFYQRQITR